MLGGCASSTVDEAYLPTNTAVAVQSTIKPAIIPLSNDQTDDDNPINFELTPYTAWQDAIFIGAFPEYEAAVGEAKHFAGSSVQFKKRPIWSNVEPAGEALIDAPLIYQMPELERGCEVTSLAMLLQHAGINVDKMTLAAAIHKDSTPFTIKDHMIHFGNPNDGFVGDMATFEEPGYGVYHQPVKELAETYLQGQIIDATGAEFDDLYHFLDQGVPVWGIVNMDYVELDDDAFETWDTPEGTMDITYREHSVLVTGYDDHYIYINDPLGEEERTEKADFIAAWNQMGRQAITYVKFSQQS
ncbi:peptidase C39 [Paenibacillus cremeus]|uniref:Peptidase C39 n=2 Tax=Paenibacillus cremeus TaxID=2163881 RepID=A0A559KDI2_9BACL|nr:peptidase C39 [Paenibacillus cremeus]